MKTSYVLITGVTSGLGLEIAKIYAQKQYHLILIARDNDRLQELSKQLMQQYQCTCVTFCCDLANRSEYMALADQLIEQNLIPSILINNAGIGGFGPAIERNISDDFTMMELNMHAVVYFCQTFAPLMKQYKQAYILNIASAAAFVPGPYQAVYYASKAFIHSYTVALQVELKHTNIHVASFCPGRMTTNFHEKAQASLKEGTLPTKYFAQQAYLTLMRKKVMKIAPFKMRLMIFAMRFLPNYVIHQYVFRKSAALFKQEN